VLPVGDNFYDGLESFGAAPAVITEQDELLTYARLAAVSDRLRAELEPRSVALLACGNNLESIVGYLACLRARVVPLLVSSAADVGQLATLIEAYQPEYSWVPNGHALAATGEVAHLSGGYRLMRNRGQAAAAAVAPNPALGLLLTTSGSTGSPALVRLSYGNIDSNTDSIVKYLGIGSGDRPITTLPMSYTYGLSILNTHLRRGATIILTSRSVVDKAFWETLRRHEATTFGGVPYTYEMMWKLRFPKMDIPSVRILTQAGGKLAKDLARDMAQACAAKSIKFIVMYGQAEATARMSYLPAEQAVTKAGSIGVAIPGGSLWLEDATGAAITAPNVEGELVFKGANVSLGYAYSRDDLAKGDENNGVLKTGDLAIRDADGCFYITGRKKRFLKLFGNRVNLDDVERLLSEAGFECACAGVDDHLKVFTTQTDGHARIRQLLAERTGIHPSAFDVTHIPRIPRNESGKIVYPAMA
jgi:acyl-coenzyme A synthetase/AMP-(fatty) acid ligase